jgi:hypothetical protein
LIRTAAVIVVAAGAAHANPRPLPMTYTTDTQAPGNAELELFVDMIPLRAISPTTTEETSYLASGFSVEKSIVCQRSMPCSATRSTKSVLLTPATTHSFSALPTTTVAFGKSGMPPMWSK